MGFGTSPKSPSFTENRRGWNSVWERDLATVYGSSIEISPPGGRSPPSLLDGLSNAYFDMMMSESNTASIHSMKTQICTLQRDLTRKASRRFAEDDFETHWMTRCSAKEREEHILEGLVRTCQASPDFEAHRQWCPELTLARLNDRSGKGYLDLLSKMLHPNIDQIPDEFKTVPNAMYEKMNRAKTPNSHPGYAIARLGCDCGRMYLLTMFVWNVLLAFYGESETYGLMKNQKSDSQDLKQMKAVHKSEFKGKAPFNVQDIIDETTANRLLAERHCTACGLPAAKAGVPSLSACQRCKAIDRLVFYCSKKCQTTDWKTGHPPHKTICGKKGAVAEALLSPPAATGSEVDPDDDGSGFPPPQPGFVRSPALLHQLKLLKENPQMDYVLVQPAPHPDHGVVLQHAMGDMLFKLCMQRAVCAHSPREVYMMYQSLEPTARRAPGFGVEKLKKQLMKEYGVDIDEVARQK